MPIYKMEGKKNGKQKYRVRVNYTDREGKAKQLDRVAYGAEEAKELERQLNYNLKEETSGKLTVQALYDEYINAKQYEVRESTTDRSKDVLNKYVLPILKDYRIDKLTMPILQKWKTSIEEHRTTKGQPFALKSKRNIFSEFRAMLNYAVKMEYIERNPLSILGDFKSAYVYKKEVDYYTSDEFLKFIQSAKDAAINSENTTGSIFEWHFYVFFAIAFYTGLRKGEIHALRWSSINDKILQVRCSITQKIKGEDRETPPKNKSSIRDLQMPQPLIDILNEHRKRCKVLNGFSDNWHICGGERSLRDTTIQNRNKDYAAAAGIKTIRIHDFRHSHVSVLANSGINIQEIARRLGHSKIEMTWNTYSHLYPREEERAVSILDKIV